MLPLHYGYKISTHCLRHLSPDQLSVCIKALFMDEPTCLPTDRECFDTLQSFVSQKRLHPVGRPFAHVLSAGQDLVSYTHYLTLKRKNPGVFSSRVF